MPEELTLPEHAKPAGRTLSGRLRAVLCTRIWLPPAIYAAVPWLYIISGLIALFSALFLPGRTWLIPWGFILGGAAIHLGLGIVSLRRRLRRR